jgi:hypothetical protein
MVEYRDPTFAAYHWSYDCITNPDLREKVENIVYGSTEEERCNTFLTFLRSDDDAAQCIALDNYCYNQTLRRWGIENEFQPYEVEIAEIARKQLQKAPITVDIIRPIYIGANHASALFVLWHLGIEVDCGLIEPVLRTSQDSNVLALACYAIGTCLSGSQTIYPEILQNLRNLIFETNFNDPATARVCKEAIGSLFGYKVDEAETILTEALQHENYEISAGAAFVLVQWNLPRYWEQIQQFMLTWPEDGNYPVNEVRRQVDEYLNPPTPKPKLSEKEKISIKEENRKKDVENARKSELEKYTNTFTPYFWNHMQDLALKGQLSFAILCRKVGEILISLDSECVDQFHQLLSSDCIPVKCSMFEIFAFHHMLGRYGIKNPFEKFAKEVLAQARIQVVQEPITGQGYMPVVGANHASALLILKYLGDSSDLSIIEKVIHSSEDVNVLLQGWQAIRHCSGEHDVLYPELISNAEKILSVQTNQQSKLDILELFHDYKVEGVERLLIEVAQDSYFSSGPYIRAKATLILAQWNLPKYIDIVQTVVNYYALMWKDSSLFAIEELQKMLQEYEKNNSGKVVGVDSAL